MPGEGGGPPRHLQHHAPQPGGGRPPRLAGTAGGERGHRGDPGGCGGAGPGQALCPLREDPREHPGQRVQLPGRPGLARSGGGPGDPGPGAEPFGDRRDPGQNPQGLGTGGLRPRGHVRVLLRPVPAVQLHDRAGRQPGGLRPALPVPVRPHGGEAPGGVFPRLRGRKGDLYPHLPGHVYDRPHPRPAGRRSGLFENRGPGQVGLLRRHRHRRLPPRHRRCPGRGPLRPRVAGRGGKGEPPALLHRLLLRPAGAVYPGRPVHPGLAGAGGGPILHPPGAGDCLSAQQVCPGGPH